MTDSSTTVDEAGADAVDESTDAAEGAGSDVAAGDGGDGTDEPTRASQPSITPEAPIKDRLLLPFLLPWLCIAAVAALRAEHLPDLPRR